MTNVMQTASRLALIATLTATPAMILAQTTTQDAPAATEETATEDAAKPVTDATESTQDTGTAATEEADTSTADAADPAATDDSSADVAESTDPAATEAPESDVAESTEPAATDQSSTDMTAQGTTDTMSTDGATDMASEEPAKAVPGQIVMQSENTVLAEDLIGSSVYSETGESIGDINNLIVNLDGTVDGVVIGVGGFLGIGEKDVAIEMASFTLTTDENANTRLVTSATKADLEAAESFVTADAQRAAETSLESMPAQDPNALNNQPVTEQPVATE